MTDYNPTLKLIGESGDAFAILGRASKVFRQAGVTREEIDAMVKEATQGDYDHLLATVMKYADNHGIEIE